MKILLVEDDSIQAELIGDKLVEEFAEHNKTCTVERIATESDFRRSFESIARNPPDLIVMDVMLRWCDISENMVPPPPECEDFSRAGVRCCQLLKADARTQKVPLVVLTVLYKNDWGLPPGCPYVPKTSDFTQLINEALFQLD